MEQEGPATEPPAVGVERAVRALPEPAWRWAGAVEASFGAGAGDGARGRRRGPPGRFGRPAREPMGPTPSTPSADRPTTVLPGRKPPGQPIRSAAERLAAIKGAVPRCRHNLLHRGLRPSGRQTPRESATVSGAKAEECSPSPPCARPTRPVETVLDQELGGRHPPPLISQRSRLPQAADDAAGEVVHGQHEQDPEP